MEVTPEMIAAALAELGRHDGSDEVAMVTAILEAALANAEATPAHD